MAVSVTCTNVRRINGVGYVRWADGTEQEFRSVAEVRDMVKQYAQSGEAQEFLRVLGLAKWLQVNPTLDNAALIIGRTLTIDLDAASNLVRVV